MDEKKFIAGFNSGYYLSQLDPTSFAKFLDGLIISPKTHTSDYMEGIKAGQKEYTKELIRETTRDRYKAQQGADQSNDKDLDR